MQDYLGGERPSLEDEPFSEVMPQNLTLPTQSLLDISGDGSLAEPAINTGLARGVAKAWVTPMRELTCSQVSQLVGQKFGLRWLALPVLALITADPTAECRFYPGDLSLAALGAFAELLKHARPEARAWISGDFDWMGEAYSFDKETLDEAKALLAHARAAAGMT